MHTCKSIHEGRKRSVEHLEEWISNWKPLWATQGSVLQNMRNSSAVHWSSPESHTEIDARELIKENVHTMTMSSVERLCIKLVSG